MYVYVSGCDIVSSIVIINIIIVNMGTEYFVTRIVQFTNIV